MAAAEILLVFVDENMITRSITRFDARAVSINGRREARDEHALSVRM